MTLASSIAEVESAIPDPHRGLPEEVFLFASRIVPLVNVDLLIRDDSGRTLLTWRDDRFYGAGWHVPGGIIRYKESAADRIRACARHELGAEVSFDSTPMLVSEVMLQSQERGHCISLLYRCRLLAPLDENRRAGQIARRDEWRWHESCPSDLLPAQADYARFMGRDA